MIIIDPLKDRLLRHIKVRSSNPKISALHGYGSNEDLLFLSNEVKNVIQYNLLDDARRYLLIDLTPPFLNFTQQQNIIDLLEKFQNPRPVVLIKENQIDAWNSSRERSDDLPIPFVVIDSSGCFKEILGGSNPDTQIIDGIEEDFLDLQINTDHSLDKNQEQENLSKTNEESHNSGKEKQVNIGGEVQDDNRDTHNINSPNCYKKLRLAAAQRILFQSLIQGKCIEFPRESNQFTSPEYIVSSVGRYYQVLKNGMLVSCYLNLKRLGADLNLLFNLVYELFLCLENYFIENKKGEIDFTHIITTNNTSLYLSSLLQTIYSDKTLIPIDKLGPIPSLRLHSEELKTKLKNKKVILIEEVVGTGSELDRAILFLNHMRSDIKNIIAIYDLEVGKSYLANNDLDYTALCTPKEELKYEYRSN